MWTDWKLVGLGCSLLYIRFGRSVHACVRTAKLAVPAWCWMITHFINSVPGGVDWQQACRRFVRPLPPRSGSMSLRVPAKRWACACRLVCTLHWADVSMWRERERECERAVLHACTALHCSQSSFVVADAAARGRPILSSLSSLCLSECCWIEEDRGDAAEVW